MSIAFIFPGQGSQFVGMGREFGLCSVRARQIFQMADESLGFPLSELCFEGPTEKLQLTENTQPAILTHSYIAADALMQQGVQPDFVAGHSLGEITAATVLGAFTFDEGVRLVRNRGRYMQEAVPAGMGAMSAIIGLASKKISEICADYSPARVSIANINTSQQIVISGLQAAVDEVGDKAKENGALRVIPLSVSAPFHCQLMQPAADKLAGDLDRIDVKDLTVPLITNADVIPVLKGDHIRKALIKQVDHPVRWMEIVQDLVSKGVTTFIEIGPGRVLSGFMRRIGVGKNINTYAVQDPESLGKTLARLKQE